MWFLRCTSNVTLVRNSTSADIRHEHDPLEGIQMMSPRLTANQPSTTNMQQHHTTSDIHNNHKQQPHTHIAHTTPHHTTTSPSPAKVHPLYFKWHAFYAGKPGQFEPGSRQEKKRASWTIDRCHCHWEERWEREERERNWREIDEKWDRWEERDGEKKNRKMQILTP